MDAESLVVKTSRFDNFASRLSAVFVILYFIVAFVLFIMTPILGIRWINHPNLGVFVNKSLEISSIKMIQGNNLEDLKLTSGDRILAVDGELIQGVDQLINSLDSFIVGETIGLDAIKDDGTKTSAEVILRQFSGTDLLVFGLLPYFISLIIFGSGIWVFTSSRRSWATNVYAIFSTSAALAILLLFDSLTTSNLVNIWFFALAVTGGSIIHLSLTFPIEESSDTKIAIFRWLSLGLAVLIFSFSVLWQNFEILLNVNVVYIVISFSFFTMRMLYIQLRTEEPRFREISRLILISTVLAGFPLLIWLILFITPARISFSPIFFTSIFIFPLTIAYNIHRPRSLQTDFIASQVLLYSILTALAAFGYGLIVMGASLITNGFVNLNNPFLIGILAFLLAVVFFPLRENLNRRINKAFGRDQEALRQHIQTFSHDLTQAMDITKLNMLVRHYLDESLSPNHIHIFLNTPGSDQYVALPDQHGILTSDLVFTKDSGLVSVLSARRAAIYLGNPGSFPLPLLNEKARLALLGSLIYVPLPGRQRLIGWISLGSRRFGKLYSQREMNFLETISDQTALAFERAQVIQDLEQRVKQMNVLTRMTQGINITTTFDDILELIYAQSSQILPASDFRIALVDERSKLLTYAFYVENDERLIAFENIPVHERQGLEFEILKQSRPIITEDFTLECKSRNYIVNPKDIYAWIGVPLNSGSETIGVLSLGSRDPSINYTQEQVNLFQAIADQAAGAILKARLFDEAERRAIQLATLNSVAQNLSSTLELVPLFNLILKSAVQILNCEAGSLLLIDEDTGEYKFEAAVGPVAENLIGSSLPPGTGLVGKAVTTKEAVIANDVRRSKEWSTKTDDNTGYKTNDLLVVPMIYRDDVTGVIEVINRLDEQPFTQDDQELLSAFTNQAAVALENARLFTLTDQTLTERVEELSVLQRIDRELNTSLDIDRALRVTLDWAMRQSRADAGLIGILQGDSIRIMASQGYENFINDFQDQGLPITIPSIQTALETGLPQFIDIDTESENQSVLPEAKQQIVITIRRETQVIGLVLLESLLHQASEEESFGFLTRLADHASIAITNASLYSEVQAANQAKSDFVSFVSHELKTPMTSIRGFTDLLASGVVGAINENQTNFLNTIRSNVDRMATLVSDLTDVSRIEAGRLHLEFGSISVQEIVDEVVRSTRAQILEKKQTLIVDVADSLPYVWGDRVRLIQILSNLVSNAYKYTQAEGLIQINAVLTENKWTEGSPEVILLSVKDNGYGISPENQEMIFQKFYRSDDQKVRDTPGTGLGLNITKQLVELQGGAIWFESKFREGTIFSFTIPTSESTE